MNFVINQVSIIFIQLFNVLPCTSLWFVLHASSHLISSGCCALVSWQGVVARGSVVTHDDAISMRPTVSVWIQWRSVADQIMLALLAFLSTHEQLTRRCFSVVMVAVAARSSFVSVVLLLLNAVNANLSAAVAVARFASASACCCCMSSITEALAFPPLMQCAPYISEADVCGWTWISRNSCAKNSL